jgi:tripeptide aminopeptidase
MKEKVVPKIHCRHCRKAMKEVNIKPLIKPIRGGTDGCQLSYKGCLVQIFLPADIFMVNTNTFLLKAKKAVDVIVK